MGQVWAPSDPWRPLGAQSTLASRLRGGPEGVPPEASRFEGPPLRSMSKLVVGADASDVSLEFGAGAYNPEGAACIITVRLC
jgi:hypothetical protein